MNIIITSNRINANVVSMLLKLQEHKDNLIFKTIS